MKLNINSEELLSESQIKDLYFDSIKTIILTEEVQMMKGIRHHGATTCYDHSVMVSYYSFRLCLLLGFDYKSAARGGILHDLFLYDWRVKTDRKGLHGFTHGRTALENSQNVTSLNPVEEDIILKHMWPLTLYPPKFKESLIVCLIDKYCASLEIITSMVTAK